MILLKMTNNNSENDDIQMNGRAFETAEIPISHSNNMTQ